MGLFSWLFRRCKKPSGVVFLRNGMKCRITAELGWLEVIGSSNTHTFTWEDGERIRLIHNFQSDPLKWTGGGYTSDYDVVSYG